MFKINDNSLIHVVLGHSYLVYFASLLFGLFLDITFNIHIPLGELGTAGFIVMAFGTLLVYWAQNTSHKFNVKQICSKEGVCVDDFFKGPYTFSRSPTHLGIFLLVIGFGFVLQSFSIVAMTTFAYFLTRYVFVSKQERLLEYKYGDIYRAYKARVKF